MFASAKSHLPRRNIDTTPPAAPDDAESTEREALLDEELDESFPASDPPSWVQGTAPARH